MRATIEIPDSQHARLVQLAAERGEKGFSSVVQEAIEFYLAMNQARGTQIAAARAVLGTFGDDEAQSLRSSVARLRET